MFGLLTMLCSGRSQPRQWTAWATVVRQHETLDVEWRTMMNRFPCPYLGGEVELTEERERHITERHPDLLPEYRQ